MSFDSLQERLTALQETTAQARELIDRLANLKFQPGSVPLANREVLGDGDDDSVAAELSGEIGNILREEEEDLELLGEEITDLRGGRDGSDAARQKERLREGAARLEGEVKR
jgi:protein transport protein SEC20